jgi:predicted nucleic acid-binding protein
LATITIDSCVAAKWFLAEDGADRAAILASSDDVLCAPDLLVAEVGNVFWKACRQARASAANAARAMSILPSFFDELVPHADHADRALELSLLLDHPIYDCFYLAVAESKQAPLITADRKLIRKVAGTDYELLVRTL